LLAAAVTLILPVWGAREAEATRTLFGSYGIGAQLLTIDPMNGVSVVVGQMPGVSYGLGMAYAWDADELYTRNQNTLCRVDPVTANTTEIGPSGSNLTGLAFSLDYSTLFSVDPLTGEFYTVDPLTGAAAYIGSTGMTQPIDLARAADGTLWAADLSANLYAIDPADGQSTLVWPQVDARGFTAIAYDDVMGGLFAVTKDEDKLVFVDTSDGSSDEVSDDPLPAQDIRGLVMVPEPATLILLACS
jgi:streptogramin lyase